MATATPATAPPIMAPLLPGGDSPLDPTPGELPGRDAVCPGVHEGTSEGISDSWLPVRVVLLLRLLVLAPLEDDVVDPLMAVETEAEVEAEETDEARLEEAVEGLIAVFPVS